MPFEQARFNLDLQRLLESDQRDEWSWRGRSLDKAFDLRSLARCAADLLERFAAGGEAPSAAFCAYRYAPEEPKYRALVPVMEACRDRGLNVSVYAHAWRGPVPAGVELVRVPVAAMGEGKRFDRYSSWVVAALRRAPNACVVGFECLPGVQFCYGDDCRSDDREAPRCRPATPIGMAAAPSGSAPQPRRQRAGLRMAADAVVFAMAGGDLAAHGFERLLTALSKLPADLRQRCHLLALGGLPDGFAAAVRVLDLQHQVHLLAAGATCAELILAADIFVELAYAPSSCGWIFDAMAAGRAVVTHEWIDEAALVREAEAGIVLAAPFRQSDCNRALANLVDDAAQRRRWQANAARFAANPAHYGHAAQAAERIAEQARRHGAVSA